MVRLLIGALGAIAFLAPVATATTWIVNASGGGNFTDIQTAILASQPGDVLLVQPGTYAAFALDRGITIIGYGTCGISGTLSIAGVPTGQTASVIDIESNDVAIQGCAGHVILQDTILPTVITVQDCLDVRFARVQMPVHFSATPVTGLTLTNARLELVSSRICGANAAICTTSLLDGAVGLRAATGVLHAARSVIRGGSGSSCAQANYYGGAGLEALVLDLSSQGLLCGRSVDQVEGGVAGTNGYYMGCTFNGWAACAVTVLGTSGLRTSGVSVFGHAWSFGINCQSVPACAFSNYYGLIFPPVADPTLTVSGSPAAGSPLVFAIDGPVGAAVVLSFGRAPTLQNTPNTLVPILVPPLRNVSLGTIGTSGSINFTWLIPAVMQPGARLIAQALVTLPSGEMRRTNSSPVIVR